MQRPFVYRLQIGARAIVSGASRVLPQHASIRLERRMRGYEEAYKLARADYAVVSYGKSGRTWLRVLLSRYFAGKAGFPDDYLLEFDEFRRRQPGFPAIFFTHDNYISDYLTGPGRDELFRAIPVVLLVRDPRDTVVSLYFQWKHRMGPRKKAINLYPPPETDMFSFMMREETGLPKIIAFMNDWAERFDAVPHKLLATYEDLRADTAKELERVLRFMGQSPTASELEDCVSFGSIDNMREREKAAASGANPRIKASDPGVPSSFKARQGKVGGWRDHVTAAQADAIDALIAQTLSPVFSRYMGSQAKQAAHALGGEA
jgi:Sulfotransferase domain